MPVHFEALVDPTREVFASKEDLIGIDGAAPILRTDSSGILLRSALAQKLERAVVGRSAKPISDGLGSNPDWKTDELIVALSFYLKHRPNPPGKDSSEIAQLSELSETLNRLGERLFSLLRRLAKAKL